ncbi:MAG: acyl--CoA ligase [Myxococcales bacterium]|nr:acyl--CoA ligase [Myxococcales bacterium]
METSDPRLTPGRFLADVAKQSGDRRALVFEGREISYRQLERESRLLARALIGAGVVKGARVGVYMANRPEWIFAYYAAAMLGAVLVPVNTFATREELRHILRHGDVSLLMLQPTLLKHPFLDDLLADYPDLARGTPQQLQCNELPQLRAVYCLGIDAPRGGVETWGQLLAHGAGVSDALLDACCAGVEPVDDGLIIYTSGTTSLPKGVLHSQRAGVIQGWHFRDLMRFDPDDRLYTTYPFFWTAGIAMSLNATLAAGACLLLQEAFEPGAALDLIESERATAIHAWPHQQKALGEHESAAGRNLSSVRKIDFSSPIAKLAGIEKDQYSMGASYGLSETFTLSSAIPADSPLDLRRSTHGKPLPGMILRIVDPETGERLPAGEEGEIAVKGPSLMRGYYKIAPENVFDEAGFFRTQDGGSIDADGYLHWSGRLSNLIKTGGANVSPVEIEHALEKHPDIKLGIPVGIEHPTLGEIVILCTVPVEGASLDEDEIRSFLRTRLAVYKIPKRVLVFRADELSYTGNQKVQVAPLKEAALERLQSENAEIDGHTYQKIS